MANKTSIEWTDYNWNFLRGCSRVSEGCRNCYAEKIAARFSGEGQPYYGLAQIIRTSGVDVQDGRISTSHATHSRWTGEISFHEDILLQPLRWTKPRKVFVNSMSDLFHEKVSDEMLDKAFAVMALTPQHTYQILTKRPERMMRYFGGIHDVLLERWWDAAPLRSRLTDAFDELPLPNVWLGVSVEDQKTFEERWPLLASVPAAVRWLSCEPLLGPIDFFYYGGDWGDPISFSQLRGTDATDPDIPGVDWIVVGGESGSDARPCQIEWLSEIVNQCYVADVPVFVKQLGARPRQTGADSIYYRIEDRKGGNIDEFPDGLKIREFPRADTLANARVSACAGEG
jgi:protein gp37